MERRCKVTALRDITGQKFGILTAIEPTDERDGTSVVWKCRCDCGNIRKVSGRNLCNGRIHSCGCLKGETVDITEKKFGWLTALEPTEKRQKKYVVWKCQCDCGNIAYVSRKYLVSGEVQSCGCMMGKVHAIDISGQRFGRLTAIEPTSERATGSIKWLCKCDCGNECKVSIHYLRGGGTKSCGCLRKEYYSRGKSDDKSLSKHTG